MVHGNKEEFLKVEGLFLVLSEMQIKITLRFHLNQLPPQYGLQFT